MHLDSFVGELLQVLRKSWLKAQRGRSTSHLIPGAAGLLALMTGPAPRFPMLHPFPPGMGRQRDGRFGTSLLEAPSPALTAAPSELLKMLVGQRSPGHLGALPTEECFYLCVSGVCAHAHIHETPRRFVGTSNSRLPIRFGSLRTGTCSGLESTSRWRGRAARRGEVGSTHTSQVRVGKHKCGENRGLSGPPASVWDLYI